MLLSSAWPLTKVAITAGATPLWFAEGRAALSCAVAFGLVTVSGRLAMPARSDWPAVLAIGGLQIGLYFALAHEAVAWVPAGKTAILANTTTVWVVPLSLLFLHESIPARRWLGTALGLAGVAVLVNPLAIDWSSGHVLVGHAFLLGAALAWSVAIIVVRAVPPNGGMLGLLPWCFLVGAAVLAPVVWWHAPSGSFGGQPVSWAALGYVGLLAAPFGTLFIMQATVNLPALVSSLGFLTTPAISLVLASVVLHEPMTPALLAGSGLIMSAAVCAAWPERRRP